MIIGEETLFKLKKMLKLQEGFRDYPYEDSSGILTIGYGRNLESVGIREKEADYMMAEDIFEIENKIAEQFEKYIHLKDARKAVLLDMAFNMGVSGLFKFVGMLSCISRDDYVGASIAMLNSKWASQVPSRAKELSIIMEKGYFDGN